MSADTKRELDLELWLDESKYRQCVATRLDGKWKVKLATHGCVVGRLMYVEGEGRSFNDAIEDALDELERQQAIWNSAAAVSP